VLTAAFAADPLFALLFPGAREDALSAWFRAVATVIGGCRYGRLRAGEAAAAVWTTAECPSCLAALDEALTDLIDPRAAGEGMELVARVRAAAVPVEPSAWCLHWLGVRPEHRRRGEGGRLLSEVTAAARAAGAVLMTTTANPDAVAFYGRGGLQPIATREVVGQPGLRVWTLRTVRVDRLG